MQVFLLTGHRKSGTSLFHRLFDGHDAVDLYPVDISVLYAYFPCFTANLDNTQEELRSRLYKVLRKSLTKIEPLSGGQSIDADQIAEKMVSLVGYQGLRSKKAVIEAVRKTWKEVSNSGDDIPFVFKETSQAVFFQEFKEAFRHLKMVAVIRDPRDNYAALKTGVANYYTKMGESDKTTLASLINRVRMDLMAASRNKEQYPESFLAIRFEDLVRNTEQVMRQVALFLDIPFSEVLLTPTLMNSPYRGNSHDGRIFLGISDENIGNWKERITESEAKIIEYWLGSNMDDWKYPREYSDIEGQKAFAEFYEWYNCSYFYRDSYN